MGAWKGCFSYASAHRFLELIVACRTLDKINLFFSFAMGCATVQTQISLGGTAHLYSLKLQYIYYILFQCTIFKILQFLILLFLIKLSLGASRLTRFEVLYMIFPIRCVNIAMQYSIRPLRDYVLTGIWINLQLQLLILSTVAIDCCHGCRWSSCPWAFKSWPLKAQNAMLYCLNNKWK